MKEQVINPGQDRPKILSREDAIALANQINDENPGECCQVKWMTEPYKGGYIVVREHGHKYSIAH